MITVAAVHGNGGGAFRFSRLPRPLADDVDLVALELPGFGEEPAQARIRSAADHGAHLAALVARLPRPRVLLGHGIGGSIALSALQVRSGPAVADGPLVDGLILHSIVGVDLDRRLFPLLMRPRPVRRAVKHAIASPPVRVAARGRLFGPDVPAEVSDRFLAEYARCEGFEDAFDWLTPAWFDALRPVAVPTSLLWGEDDRVLDVDHVERYRPLVPEATVTTVPGWGHFPMVTDPDGYAERVAAIARSLVAESDARGAEDAPARAS